MGHIKFVLTLSPESPGLPGGPEAPGGPGRPYFKQNLILHTLYIKNPTKRNCHICVLSVPLQSGHTWEKGMHETIWDSLFAAVNPLRGTFYLSTDQRLNGWTLWDCRASGATMSKNSR